MNFLEITKMVQQTIGYADSITKIGNLGNVLLELQLKETMFLLGLDIITMKFVTEVLPGGQLGELLSRDLGQFHEVT